MCWILESERYMSSELVLSEIISLADVHNDFPYTGEDSRVWA